MSYGGGYTTTSYGAQGGADGGGFMGGSQQGSQGGAGKGTYGKDTLRPVTIKQILDAKLPHPDGDFKIDDVEITQIHFIGQIRNISTQATNITYKLDDGTGAVEVKQWIDTDTTTSMDMGDGAGPTGGGASSSKPKLTENEWACVWGKLKEFNNKRHVGAHVIRPVKDKMEIQYHLLASTAVHLYFTRGPLDQIKQEDGAGGDANMDHDGRMAGNNGQASVMPSLSGAAKQVHQTLKSSPQSNEGLHVQNIAAIARMNVAEVRKAGDELMSHSLIFTTVDDDTWALLEF